MDEDREKMIILEATGITKIFPGVELSNESISLVKRKHPLYCRENGAGKSTFVKSFNWYLSS